MLPNPTIVIPGITASYLKDEYNLPPKSIWTVMHKDYERSAMHPDDLRYERIEPARVTAGQVYEICYKDLIEELRYNLRETEEETVPVYPFGYDWRQPLEYTEEVLKELVDEVIARTRLLRHYDQDAEWQANPKVNLVGHSMGGLVITGYLERYGEEAQIGKVATLGTPYDGSLEAIVKITTGTANLGTEPPSSREREAARLTPALYYLLPGFDDGISYPDGLPGSVFSPEVWQPSILQTLEQYIKRHGLNPDNAAEGAKTLFNNLLNMSGEHRQRIKGFAPAQAGLGGDDWLCVAGVDAPTRVQLGIIKDGDGKPAFKFTGKDRLNHWEEGGDAGWRTGDGTVPLRGAVPEFLEHKQVVCVTPSDFGYWELIDRGLVKLQGFHGFIPAMNMLHRLIVRHFTGRPDPHGNSWGRPLPGVSADAWQPPLSLRLKED